VKVLLFHIRWHSMKKYTKQRTVCYTDEDLHAVRQATAHLGMELNAFIRWASVNTARHVLNQPHAYIGRKQTNRHDRPQQPEPVEKMNQAPRWEDSY
jgi:hypothetical protein